MNALRRRAWWILVAISLLVVVFGLTDVLIGATADPGIPQGLTGRTPAQLEAESSAAYRIFDFASRSQGLLLVVVGVLMTVILVIPYRRGERWAWNVAWVLPAWFLAVPALYVAFGLAPDQPLPPPVISGPILGIVAVVVIVLDRERFLEQPR